MLSTTLTAEGREAAKRAAADRRAVVRLLREMHAFGWRHQLVHQVSHDPETGAPEPYQTHTWTRGDESIEVDRDGELIGALLYRPHPEAGHTGFVTVGVDWIAEHGVRRLAVVASAAGVLSVPKEQTA